MQLHVPSWTWGSGMKGTELILMYRRVDSIQQDKHRKVYMKNHVESSIFVLL